MSKNYGLGGINWLRVVTAMATMVCIAAGCLLAGCGGSRQVDKYTVTDADRQAAKAASAGGGTAPPKDTHDGAAYGPDGKPMK